MLHPLLVSTWSFGRRANAAAWPRLAEGGCGIDAVVAACHEAERDPDIDSVGYGGLPDRDGAMSFDACVMRSPREVGAVCAMRRTRHPAAVARLVMQHSAHVLLAGEGADRFAAEHGVDDELPETLVAPKARAAWERLRSNPSVVDQSQDAGFTRPVDRTDSGRLFGDGQAPDDEEARWRHHDTLGVLALDAAGRLTGACTTSGTPLKTPGRVGDSPIVGHGLYVDPAAGACVATGSGERMMGVCTSAFVVERMRGGDAPRAALEAALCRLRDAYDLDPTDQCGLIALAPDGRWASAALRAGYRTSVRTTDRDEVVEPDLVLLAEA